MGTTLTGLTPATTYDALIKVGDNGPLSATAKYVGDGLGNDSVLALSTNRVGIATFAPTQVLDVNGNMRLTGAFYDSGNAAGTSGQILSSTGTGTDWVSKSDLSLVDGSGTANYVSKWSDTDTLTNSLIYDNGTNIGVGTNNPTFKVQVNSADVATAMFRSSAAATVVGIDNSAADGDPQLKFFINDIGTFTLGVDDSDSDKFKIGTSDLTTSTRLTIDSTGNVGIGNSSPVGKLHIAATTGVASLGSTALAIRDSSAPTYGFDFTLEGVSTGDMSLVRTELGVQSQVMTFKRSNGNVGIGTSSPAQKLQVSGTGVTRITVENTDNQSTGAGLQMLVKNGGSTVGDGTIRTDNADNMQFFNIAGQIMELTSTGNLSLTTGNIALSGAGGIYFDSGASKYLDDYEVGTWTMGISFGGASVGVTYSVNTGTYTKIGRQVTVNGYCVLTSKGSSTGTATITGLPFTIGNTDSNYCAASISLDSTITFTGQAQGYGSKGQTYIVLTQMTEGGSVSQLTNTNFANNSAFILSLTYFV